MNAAETIQAAIDKLEAGKAGDGFCVGPWQYLRKGSWGGESAVADSNGHPLAWVGDGNDADRDAELIVMLHRTIDAQLAILRTGLTLATAFPNSEWTNTVNLARSILGEDGQ
jgi:hypothetical protein